MGHSSMALSQRIRAVVGRADDGWSLYYRARAMKAAGEPVVMLTIGDHDIKTDASILDAMKASMDAGNLGYSGVMGSDALRDAIARRVAARTDIGAARENIIVTPGGQAALFASLMAVLDPGQSCIVLDPFYATFAQTVRAAGGRAIMVKTPADQGFQPDISAIEQALEPDTKAILICHTLGVTEITSSTRSITTSRTTDSFANKSRVTSCKILWAPAIYPTRLQSASWR